MSVKQLKNLSRALRAIPKVAAQDIARAVGPDLTGRTQTAFDMGVTVFGDPRPEGKTGPVTLHRTGALESGLNFKVIGTIVRAVLGVKYARYNVRFGILPRKIIPVEWTDSIRKISKGVLEKALAV